MDTDGTEYRFDVAVSFAGDDRELVEAIVTEIEGRGLRVFYDERFKAELWGEDLIDYFTRVYMDEARYAVIFVSQHYAEKIWTNLERRTVLARALEQKSAYVLPIRLDDTRLPGLLPTIGYLDARHEGVDGVVSVLLEKVGQSDTTPATPSKPIAVPKSVTELDRLLLVRPELWEYFAFAGLLRHGKQQLEERYLDFEMGFAPHSGSIAGMPAYEYLSEIPDRMMSLAERFGAVLNTRSQDAAFGAPGEPGDIVRIRHLAQRLLDIYSSFFDIADELRGKTLPNDLRDPRDRLIEALIPSVGNIREFIDQLVSDVDDIPRRLEAGEVVAITPVLELTIDHSAMDRYLDGMKRARRRL